MAMTSRLSRKRPAEVDPEPDAVSLSKGPGAKGKATPKRSESIKARPVTPYMKPVPSGTKKERAKAARQERGGSMTATRAALKGQGDVGLLPPRDKPPERGLARSIVDGRRNLTTFVLGIYVLFVLLELTKGAVRAAIFSLMLVGLLIVIADGFVLTRMVKRAVREAYPETRVKVTLYSFQRSLLPPRFRLPRKGVGVPAIKKRA